MLCSRAFWLIDIGLSLPFLTAALVGRISKTRHVFLEMRGGQSLRHYGRMFDYALKISLVGRFTYTPKLERCKFCADIAWAC